MYSGKIAVPPGGGGIVEKKNNKTKHKQNSKKEELKEMLKMSTIQFKTQLCTP
jgi:hypothetical protein